MRNLTPLYVKGKTLDLGAGMAKYRKIFEGHMTEYITCDTFAAPHIDVVANAHALPLENGSFDTVICTMVLEHVEKPWIVAGEIERVLKPGGHCIIAVPFLFPEHKDPEDYFRYTTAGLASLFPSCSTSEGGGYGGIAATLDGFFYVGYYDFYRKNHGFIRRNIYRCLKMLLHKLDRFLPSPSCIYRSTYFVGKKQ